MDRHENEDRELRNYFDAARETDREAAPEFHRLVARERPARPGRRGQRIVWMATAASVAVVTFAAWLGTQAPPVSLKNPELSDVAVAAPPPAVWQQTETNAPADVRGKWDGARPNVEAGKDEGSPVPPAPEVAQSSQALGYVGEKPVPEPQGKERSDWLSDQLVEDLPVPGRFYQGVLTLAPGAPDAGATKTDSLHGARERDFKAVVGGTSNVGPPADQGMIDINRNSIEEMEVVTAGEVAELLRAQGGPAQTRRIVPAETPAAFNTESYGLIEENRFLEVTENPLSTFSIDVDTASYANVRRFLNQGQRPPRDAVRIEEMLNYFRYDYPEPRGRAPFGASIEVAECPWNPEHRLARIGLKGREIDRSQREPSNLVFLIDVSGSMNEPNKLPLLQASLALLVQELDDRDRVAIVVYAGSSGLVLPSTRGSSRGEIGRALERLRAGGSTNGGQGLQLAYETARANFVRGGTNRVILATDGDFNVGVTSQAELLALIEEDARRGIFLTALGFGMGNYKDSTLEMLADKGNGNYAYIDGLREARKVLVEELTGTLVTIAKDVKIQVEFNPAQVGAYRLVGYENRMLRKEDFNDDRKDAGEIGAGHTVTALYEIVPASGRRDVELPSVDPLRYQEGPALTENARRGELFTLKLRYKEPDGERSRLLEFPAHDSAARRGSPDFEFAAAVAGFGMLLRGSEHAGDFGYDDVRALAADALGRGEGREYREEFVGLVDRATALD